MPSIPIKNCRNLLILYLKPRYFTKHLIFLIFLCLQMPDHFLPISLWQIRKSFWYFWRFQKFQNTWCLGLKTAVRNEYVANLEFVILTFGLDSFGHEFDQREASLLAHFYRFWKNLKNRTFTVDWLFGFQKRDSFRKIRLGRIQGIWILHPIEIESIFCKF